MGRAEQVAWGESLLEMPRMADASANIERDDSDMSWPNLAAMILLSWLALAVAVGTIVGHGIAFGTRSDSD